MLGITRTTAAVRELLSGVLSRIAALGRWSLSSVEPEPEPRIVHGPGPAHGPVPAIEFRTRPHRRVA